MTWFDLLIVSILGLSILFAWFRGLSREVSTLVALAIALIGAILIARPMGGVFGTDSIVKNLAIILIPFTLIFLIASVAIDMALDRFMGREPGSIDRWLGFAFGFLRGYLLIGLGFVALSYYFTPDNQPSMVKNAALLGFAENAAAFLSKLPINNLPDQTAFTLPLESRV